MISKFPFRGEITSQSTTKNIISVMVLPVTFEKIAKKKQKKVEKPPFSHLSGGGLVKTVYVLTIKEASSKLWNLEGGLTLSKLKTPLLVV